MNFNLIMLILGIILVISIILILVIKNKKFKVIPGILISLVIAISGSLYLPKLMDKINYGLDLQGGFEVLYQVSPIEGELNSDMVYNTYKSILKRIDILGVSEPEISIEGEDKIRIRLAGVKNKDEAREILSSTAVLTFRDPSDNILLTSDVLGGNAKVSTDNQGRYVISLSIKDKDAFYEATKKVKDMMDNRMVIWLDFEEGVDSFRKEEKKCGSDSSNCLSAPYVNEAFASDVVIQGNFTKESAKKLTDLINSGALPTKLEEISSRTVEASFGENALNKTLIAGVIGIILVIILMIIIYRFSGFITGVCFIIYTVCSLYIFYLINGVLTLPGIAAMLLGIGMAADSAIICYERIKEQLKIGNNLSKSFEIGNKTSLSSIIDSNITTIIVAIILFILGQSSVKGFATMLIINIIVTVIVMVYLERQILKLFIKTTYFDDKLNLFIGISKKKITKSKEIEVPFKKLNFISIAKKYTIGILVVIIVCGIATIFTKYNLGVDFTGGTSITINNNTDLTNDIKELNYTLKDYKIENNNSTYIIDEVLNKDEIKNLNNYIESNYELSSDIYVVSDVVKKELVKNAIKALIISSIAIIIYVSIRFKFNYAISGIIALLHDVVLTILFFGLFNIEINSTFIAAILTIIGYSINDTIVTFDMIRELYKEKKNVKTSEDINKIVDTSVKRVLSRTILTSVTTIIPVIMLLIMGAKEIVNFNVALLVGFIFGTLSSIFVSNYLWSKLEYIRITKPIKDDDDDEITEYKVKGINC
ncbi:MAG: protein translocase subunit SecD [Bacilli bacterium]|nr:protein translocase subunit SecD [Bacilli bacterium]